MGREAICHAEWNGGAGEVKALLETRELIIRGDLRRTLPLAGLTVEVDGDRLVVSHGDELIALYLRVATTAKWAARISTPPPTLAAKLGIGSATTVRAINVTDPDLVAAAAAGTAVTGNAAIVVAEVDGLTTLDAAVALAAPVLWLVYAKGHASAFGEVAVRVAMRERGWIDVKVASVSSRLTATKFMQRF